MSAVPALPVAAQSHHFVYLSSATTQTISGFEIDQVSGAVTAVAGSPFQEGRDPNGLAFHPTGRFLYAVNPGDQSVSGFGVHPATGALTELAASPFAVGGGATPRFIAVEPLGKFLYVVATQTDPLGTVVTSVSYYAIDAAGSVSPTAEGSTSPVLLSPVGIVFKPGDRFLYVAGTASSNGVYILALELNPLSGTLSGSHVSPVPGQFAKSTALAPGGQFLFVGRGQTQGRIDAYALPADGIFDPPSNTFSIAGASGGPFVLAADVSGSYLYAAVPNLGLLGFSVDSGSGALAPLPGAAFVGPPIAPTVVMATDPVAPFSNVYFEQRAFGILSSGELSELAASPLTVPGGVSGIAAASPVDQLPTDPINPISGPVTSLFPSALQFPDQLVGGSGPAQPVSLTNTGNAPLVLGEPSLTGANAPDFALSHDCVAVVNPGSGCTIAITFRPLSEGQLQASLSVVDNAPESPHTVSLTGTAQRPFSLQLDSSSSTITAGQTAQYSLRLVPASGFIGKVFLTCSGVPAQASCSLPPSLDTNGSTPMQFSVAVSTMARFAARSSARPVDPIGSYSYFVAISTAGAVLLLLFLLFLSHQTDLAAGLGSGSHRAAAVLLIYACLTLTACSGVAGNGGTPTTASPVTGTPAGQYLLTITASFGTVTEVIQLHLFVQ
jgi:6-phosphogluconolactonase (cycloisomerase 2 family)